MTLFNTFIIHTFLLVIIISGIPLAVSSIVSLFISIVQAATQVQEQSLGYLARLAVISLVFVFLGKRFAFEVLSFFQQTINSIRFLGQM